MNGLLIELLTDYRKMMLLTVAIIGIIANIFAIRACNKALRATEASSRAKELASRAVTLASEARVLAPDARALASRAIALASEARFQVLAKEDSARRRSMLRNHSSATSFSEND
ncbi:hypothetical protein [Methylobacillus rhizosphaerae]|uniref:hypothetical protein n=1 Tax=Methylobacillus rhizosphaerae TaxID=551994 RepID=UPI000B78336C|nr:hypothetical protein [Methylobacillus rhizosphaerae]